MGDRSQMPNRRPKTKDFDLKVRIDEDTFKAFNIARGDRSTSAYLRDAIIEKMQKAGQVVQRKATRVLHPGVGTPNERATAQTAYIGASMLAVYARRDPDGVTWADLGTTERHRGAMQAAILAAGGWGALTGQTSADVFAEIQMGTTEAHVRLHFIEAFVGHIEATDGTGPVGQIPPWVPTPVVLGRRTALGETETFAAAAAHSAELREMVTTLQQHGFTGDPTMLESETALGLRLNAWATVRWALCTGKSREAIAAALAPPL